MDSQEASVRRTSRARKVNSRFADDVDEGYMKMVGRITASSYTNKKDENSNATPPQDANGTPGDDSAISNIGCGLPTLKDKKGEFSISLKRVTLKNSKSHVGEPQLDMSKPLSIICRYRSSTESEISTDDPVDTDQEVKRKMCTDNNSAIVKKIRMSEQSINNLDSGNVTPNTDNTKVLNHTKVTEPTPKLMLCPNPQGNLPGKTVKIVSLKPLSVIPNKETPGSSGSCVGNPVALKIVKKEDVIMPKASKSNKILNASKEALSSDDDLPLNELIQKKPKPKKKIKQTKSVKKIENVEDQDDLPLNLLITKSKIKKQKILQKDKSNIAKKKSLVKNIKTVLKGKSKLIKQESLGAKKILKSEAAQLSKSFKKSGTSPNNKKSKLKFKFPKKSTNQPLNETTNLVISVQGVDGQYACVAVDNEAISSKSQKSDKKLQNTKNEEDKKYLLSNGLVLESPLLADEKSSKKEKKKLSLNSSVSIEDSTPLSKFVGDKVSDKKKLDENKKSDKGMESTKSQNKKESIKTESFSTAPSTKQSHEKENHLNDHNFSNDKIRQTEKSSDSIKLDIKSPQNVLKNKEKHIQNASQDNEDIKYSSGTFELLPSEEIKEAASEIGVDSHTVEFEMSTVNSGNNKIEITSDGSCKSPKKISRERKSSDNTVEVRKQENIDSEENKSSPSKPKVKKEKFSNRYSSDRDVKSDSSDADSKTLVCKSKSDIKSVVKESSHSNISKSKTKDHLKIDKNDRKSLKDNKRRDSSIKLEFKEISQESPHKKKSEETKGDSKKKHRSDSIKFENEETINTLEKSSTKHKTGDTSALKLENKIKSEKEFKTHSDKFDSKSQKDKSIESRRDKDKGHSIKKESGAHREGGARSSSSNETSSTKHKSRDSKSSSKTDLKIKSEKDSRVASEKTESKKSKEKERDSNHMKSESPSISSKKDKFKSEPMDANSQSPNSKATPSKQSPNKTKDIFGEMLMNVPLPKLSKSSKSSTKKSDDVKPSIQHKNKTKKSDDIKPAVQNVDIHSSPSGKDHRKSNKLSDDEKTTEASIKSVKSELFENSQDNSSKNSKSKAVESKIDIKQFDSVERETHSHGKTTKEYSHKHSSWSSDRKDSGTSSDTPIKREVDDKHSRKKHDRNKDKSRSSDKEESKKLGENSKEKGIKIEKHKEKDLVVLSSNISKMKSEFVNLKKEAKAEVIVDECNIVTNYSSIKSEISLNNEFTNKTSPESEVLIKNESTVYNKADSMNSSNNEKPSHSPGIVSKVCDDSHIALKSEPQQPDAEHDSLVSRDFDLNTNKMDCDQNQKNISCDDEMKSGIEDSSGKDNVSSSAHTFDLPSVCEMKSNDVLIKEVPEILPESEPSIDIPHDQNHTGEQERVEHVYYPKESKNEEAADLSIDDISHNNTSLIGDESSKTMEDNEELVNTSIESIPLPGETSESLSPPKRTSSVLDEMKTPVDFEYSQNIEDNAELHKENSDMNEPIIEETKENINDVDTGDIQEEPKVEEPIPEEPLVKPIELSPEERERRNKEVVEERMKSFKLLEENLYLVQKEKNKRSKEARRMVCDCTLSKEEIADGMMGCGEDCLNHLLMIECGSRCPLKDRCLNKRFQQRKYADVEVFNAEEKGCGVRARQPIKMGSFIMEYVGEVFDSREFRRRRKEYAKSGSAHFYFMALRNDRLIDSTRKGNISRFVNHSCSPNAETQKWTVNGDVRIGFFATQDIDAGEELNFDYRLERYGREPQKCYCGTPMCRGWLGEAPDEKTKEEKEEDKRREARDRQRKESRRVFMDDMDLEDEIEKLCSQGLRNRQGTLTLSRLMVRAEDATSRTSLLVLLKEAEKSCKRLFLDYHGLRILWSWMVDFASAAKSNTGLMMEILNTLECLPITNKTQLQDSKIMAVVEKWSKLGASKDEASLTTSQKVETQEKKSSDGSEDSDAGPSPTDTISPDDSSQDSTVPAAVEGEMNRPQSSPQIETTAEAESVTEEAVATKAASLLAAWNDLNEAFKIPKKERVQLMKEHERELDKEYDNYLKTSRDRYSDRQSSYDSWFSQSSQERDRRRSDRHRRRDWAEKRRRDSEDDDGLSKEQRRERFAQQVAKEDEERQKRLQEEMWTLHVQRCSLLGHDPYYTPIFDQSGHFYWDPDIHNWQLYVGPSPNMPVPAYYGFLGSEKPSPVVDVTGYSEYALPHTPVSDGEPVPPNMFFVAPPLPPDDPASIPLPGETPPPPSTDGEGVPELDSIPLPGENDDMDIDDDEEGTGAISSSPPPVGSPEMVTLRLPQHWKLARDASRRLYFYHTRTRFTQWTIPDESLHDVLMNKFGLDQESGSDSDLDSDSTSSSDSESDEFSSDEEAPEVVENSEGLVQKSESLNEKMIRRPKGMKNRRSPKLVQERVISPIQEESKEWARRERREAKEKARMDARKERRSQRRAKLIAKVQSSNSATPGFVSALGASEDSSTISLSPPTAFDSDDENMEDSTPTKSRRSGRSYPKQKVKGRVATAMADTSDAARKIKDSFRSKMATYIVSVLNPYRKPDCKAGRITSNEDFKYLARKLTHFVMLKELKQVPSIEELDCSESVKHKTKIFVRKYMSKYGQNFFRDPNDTKEY